MTRIVRLSLTLTVFLLVSLRAPIYNQTKRGMVSLAVLMKVQHISLWKPSKMPVKKQHHQSLTHIDESGAARMVDVGDKPVTRRKAKAVGLVVMKPETLALVQNNQLAKGDVLQVARIAGIMAAKRTPDIVPLCHPVPLDRVEIDFEIIDQEQIRISATAEAAYKTGVEMEAITAAMVAGLTIYDMCKSVDRSITVGPFFLEEKSGGRSGHFKRGKE